MTSVDMFIISNPGNSLPVSACGRKDRTDLARARTAISSEGSEVEDGSLSPFSARLYLIWPLGSCHSANANVVKCAGLKRNRMSKTIELVQIQVGRVDSVESCVRFQAWKNGPRVLHVQHEPSRHRWLCHASGSRSTSGTSTGHGKPRCATIPSLTIQCLQHVVILRLDPYKLEFMWLCVVSRFSLEHAFLFSYCHAIKKIIWLGTYIIFTPQTIHPWLLPNPFLVPHHRVPLLLPVQKKFGLVWVDGLVVLGVELLCIRIATGPLLFRFWHY